MKLSSVRNLPVAIVELLNFRKERRIHAPSLAFHWYARRRPQNGPTNGRISADYGFEKRTGAISANRA
jgi:hypothetical protein